MLRTSAIIGLLLLWQLAVPTHIQAQPMGPGGPDRLRSFSTDSDPDTLERVRAGLEPGSRDWVEATRRLAEHRATTCFDSDADDEPACTEAAALYQEALDADVTIARFDELLYDYGLLLAWLGDEATAASLWQRLMTEYSTSSLYPQAALALGEHYFTSAMLEPAREVLQIAADTPGFSGRYYALYLESWCAVNLSEYAQALDLMTQALRAAERDMPQDDALRAQMLHDLPMIYAAGGDPSRALDFFNDVAPAEAVALVEQTAAHLQQMGRVEDAETVRNLVR